VAELAHHVKGAIEHGRAERVDGEIDAAAVGKFQYGVLEIFVRRDHHTLGAIGKSELLLAGRADRADDTGACVDCELGCEQPDTAADGIDQDGVTGFEPVDGVQHVIAGQSKWYREALVVKGFPAKSTSIAMVCVYPPCVCGFPKYHPNTLLSGTEMVRMTIKISAKSVAELAPGETISDNEVVGFRARRWQSGHVTYDLRYRSPDGSRGSMPIGKHGNITADQARNLAKKYALEVANGKDPSKDRKAARAVAGNTVATVWDSYAKRELSKKRSGKEQMAAFDRLVRPQIGDRPIYEIKRSHITKLFDGIADTNGKVMSDRMLAYLGTCFRWQQVRDDDFISPIVAKMARTTEKELRRSRVLTDDEIRRLWSATAEGTFGSLIRFLLLTGARRSEAAEMPWSELRETVWHLPAARNKTKVDFARPLSADAMAILKPFERSNDFVFTVNGDPITSFSDRKANLNEAAGITSWRIHDLRRTARSLMSRAKVSREHAEIALGHVQPTIVETYDQYEYDDEKREAFEKLAALVRDIVGK
jgi:integrase